VFILKTLSGTEKFLDIRRQEVGVRIPDYPVPVRLIETLNYPLYSITAKKSMTGSSEWIDDEDVLHLQKGTELLPIPEEELFESGWELEAIDGLDMILDSGEERERIFSTILDLCSDEIVVLRQGAGSWPI
jgi:tRNA A37 threonylcarbamoyladenosine synthetase subunit TsaC/SUA5/YrdC